MSPRLLCWASKQEVRQPEPAHLCKWKRRWCALCLEQQKLGMTQEEAWHDSIHLLKHCDNLAKHALKPTVIYVWDIRENSTQIYSEASLGSGELTDRWYLLLKQRNALWRSLEEVSKMYGNTGAGSLHAWPGRCYIFDVLMWKDME